jgi:hypothetical protein
MDAKKKTTFSLSSRMVSTVAGFQAPDPPQPKTLHTAPLSSRAAGTIGEMMAAIEMLRHGIVCCEPVLDIGVDMMTFFGAVMKRVQIKAQLADEKMPGKLTFCVTKRKSGMNRNGIYMPSPAVSYADGEVDAFVFVHTELRRFYVVPASEVVNKYKMTFNLDSKWADAWYILQTPETNNDA